MYFIISRQHAHTVAVFGFECPLSLWKEAHLCFLNAAPNIMSRGGSRWNEWQLHLDRVTQLWRWFDWQIAKLFASRLNTFFFFLDGGWMMFFPQGWTYLLTWCCLRACCTCFYLREPWCNCFTVSEHSLSLTFLIAPDGYCFKWY